MLFGIPQAQRSVWLLSLFIFLASARTFAPPCGPSGLASTSTATSGYPNPPTGPFFGIRQSNPLRESSLTSALAANWLRLSVCCLYENAGYWNRGARSSEDTVRYPTAKQCGTAGVRQLQADCQGR